MLVRFDSDAGTLTMFGDIAVQFLKMMGHSGTIPGALLGRDVAEALARFKRGVAQAQIAEGPRPPDNPDDGDEEPAVGVRQRAYPLMQLMERAAERQCDILWSEEHGIPLV